MDSYQIEWKKSTAKDLRKIPKNQVLRIVEAVQKLENDPTPAGSTKLCGSDSSYRIRVGDYRVIYDFAEERIIIEVVKVGHRKDVYR